MHKIALFFEKKNWKIAAALGAQPPNPRWSPAAGSSAPGPPELLLPTPVTVISLKTFVALTSLLSKRNKNNLEISTMFCFCHSFLTSNSSQGILAPPLAQISWHLNNYDLY